MIRFHKFLLLLGIALLLPISAKAAPKPSLAYSSKVWTLDVTFEHPKQICVRCPGDKKSKNYWYTILSITNNSGKEVPFYPQIELMTDTFKVVPAGKKVPKFVYDQIQKSVQGKYPFLISLDVVPNKILQGADNSIDVAVIWPAFDKNAKNVKFFFSGFSNETATVVLPVKRAGETKKFYLRKALVLDYAVPGDAAVKDQTELLFKKQGWVMR